MRRKLSKEELEKKLREIRMELLALRSKALNRMPIKETKKIRELKRNVARILTILKEKQ